jgi:NADPH2:quinone reductase
MLAIEIREPGPPDVLTPVERPRPVPAPGELLVRVAAAGVNYPDVMQRRGHYPPPPGASDIPGLEIAGTVEEVRDVDGWEVGDEVCALVSGGGYAEYCVAPAPQCLHPPRGLDLIQAAALPETTFTVWTNVFDRGRLAPGETILIHGGTGGIGTTAIQLARAWGARVLTTAGSEAKCGACRELGAHHAFNYREQDFVAETIEVTDGHGADVIVDVVGGDYLQRDFDALAMEGRLLLIGQIGGPKAQINTTPIFLKRLTITATTLRARSVEEKGAIASAVREHVWPIIESGSYQVPIHETFPLAEAAEAHRVMEESSHIGKLVLTGS